jgi:hypothetical protein
MPVKIHEIHASTDDLAPAWCGRPHTNAKETELGFQHHRQRYRQHEAEDDWQYGIRYKMAADDVPRAGSHGLRRAHKFLFAECFDLRTYQQAHLHPAEHRGSYDNYCETASRECSSVWRRLAGS